MIDHSSETAISTLLTCYSDSTAELEGNWSRENLLTCLLLRDRIEATLRDGAMDARCVEEMLRTDATFRALQLRAYAHRKDLVRWRASLKPSEDAWWWFPDHSLPAWLTWSERAFILLSLLLFPFSLGIAIELTQRYGRDGVGPESLLPIAVTLLGSISVGGILSLRFRDRLTTLLENTGAGVWWRPAASLTILVLLILIASLWAGRSRFSTYYNRRGIAALGRERDPHTQLSRARIDLERAVRFDPANTVAHYNLGRVYEDLLEEDRAATEYLIAFRAGLDLAGNNLAHLHLLRGEYDRAALVLQQASRNALPAPSPDAQLRYSLLKNLGWARWGQKRFREARPLLEEAVRLDPARPEAHCLLARTLGALRDTETATQWRRCLGLTWQNLTEPAQDIWTGEAREFLNAVANEVSQ